jgi:hypothetical protein
LQALLQHACKQRKRLRLRAGASQPGECVASDGELRGALFIQPSGRGAKQKQVVETVLIADVGDDSILKDTTGAHPGQQNVVSAAAHSHRVALRWQRAPESAHEVIHSLLYALQRGIQLMHLGRFARYGGECSFGLGSD